jgi:nucleoid DNA-binding protein
MNKSELVAELAKSVGLPRSDTRFILDRLATIVIEAVASAGGGTTIQVVPGVVTIRKTLAPAKPARDGINPATGERIRIKAKPTHWRIKARVSRALTQAV